MSISIVCADDEIEYRSIVAGILEREGYSYKAAPDGNAAWELIQTERPDVIILDWSMPGKTGIDIARLIRRDAGLANRYVILLTGMMETYQKVHALEAGADDYITKPFDTGDLVARIRVGMRARNALKLLSDEIQVMNRALDQSPIGILVTNAEGTIQYMNGKSEAITGNRISETIGKELSAVRSAVKVLDEDGMYGAIATGTEWEGKSKQILSNGKAIWLHTMISPLRDDQGAVSHWLVVDEDITNQTLTEEALKKSESLFRSIWDTSLIGLRLTDSDGRVLRVNDAYCNIVGKTKAETEGHLFSEVYVPEGREEIQRKHKERFAARSVPPYFERKMTLWNGKTIWVESSNSFVELGGDGALLLSVFRDITVRKRAADELANERELLLTLIDNLPARIYVKDTEMRFLLNNMPHVRALGETSRHAVVGKTDFDYRPGELATKMSDDDRRVIGSGEPLLDKEEQLVSSSGQAIWVLTSKVPFRDQAGNVKGLVGIGRDITEQKILEESLKQRNIELETLLANLKQMQGTLVRSEKMASLGALTAGIAHEINNPLAYVSSNMNRLQEYFADATALVREWQTFGKSLEAAAGCSDALVQLDESAARIDLEFILQDFDTMMKSVRDGIQRIKRIVDGLRGFAHISESKFFDAKISEV
ncbi:MAG: PAS domain S-box protein, partial [Ignavibacteriae bacterium]|nr:PAS domain S-box protein [Ignavibacteriota bacterium]